MNGTSSTEINGQNDSLTNSSSSIQLHALVRHCWKLWLHDNVPLDQEARTRQWLWRALELPEFLKPFYGNHQSEVTDTNHHNGADPLHSTQKQPSSSLQAPREYRCALVFHGLPRAFESRVLPSIVRHVLIPNARYHCDVMFYYHALDQEQEGRSGAGGTLSPHSVRRLVPHVVHQVQNTYYQLVENLQQQQPFGHPPSLNHTMPRRHVVVALDHYTNQDFDSERGEFLHRIHTVHDNHTREPKPLYVPWREGFNEATTDNIVRMWHGIQGAWNLMEQTAQQQGVQYHRVAVLRADVVYTTSLDIWQRPQHTYPTQWFHTAPLDKLKLPKTRGQQTQQETNSRWDLDNLFAVIPAFSPVNDRLVYGPYDAVQIWATKRFDWIDEHVHSQRAGRGSGIHDEKYLKYTILPRLHQISVPPLSSTVSSLTLEEIHDSSSSTWNWLFGTPEKVSLQVLIDPGICFVRARADESLWITDCGHANEQLTHANLLQIEAMFQQSCRVEALESSFVENVDRAICGKENRKLSG